MGFFAWLKTLRIRRLEIELAEVEAEIACDAAIAKSTGTIYPVAASIQARRRAGLLKRLEFLKA